MKKVQYGSNIHRTTVNLGKLKPYMRKNTGQSFVFTAFTAAVLKPAAGRVQAVNRMATMLPPLRNGEV